MTNQPPPLDAERVSELRDHIPDTYLADHRKQLILDLCDHYLRATQRESGGESDAERYLANALHEKDSQAARRVGPRWWCLREDLRKLYIEKARAVIDFWAAREAETAAKYSRVDDEIAALCDHYLRATQRESGGDTDNKGALHCACEYEPTADGFPGKRIQVCGEHHALSTHLSAAQSRVKELEAAARALGNHAYASSDKHLSGYRLTIGFDTLEQVQAAHQAIVDFGKALRAALASPPAETRDGAQGERR